MNSKSLLVLLAALVIGVVAYYNSSTKQQSVDANTYLVPSLAANLNNVTKFTVSEVGNTLLSEISKTDKGWVVNNRDGYPANIKAIRIMLNNLAEAKLVEAKTSNTENYFKLGVEDISHEKAQGILFSLEGLSESNEIIIGNNGSSGKNTQYIRRKDQQQSWLINKRLNLNRDVTDWLQKDILDIPPERIKTVQIKHPDGSEVNIANDGEEEYEYTLDASAPEGMKISESEIYQVANALSSMQLRDVMTFSRLNTESITPVVTSFKTYDGLTITTKAYAIELDKFFTIEVDFSAEDIDESAVKAADNTTKHEDIATDAAMHLNPEAAAELAEKSKQKLSGWAYMLPSITQDSLIKKLESFFIEKDV